MMRKWAGLLVFGLLCAGCGSANDSMFVPASPTPSATHPAPTTTTVPPTTSVTAANGADLGACRSGNCEVRVTGPVTIQLAAALEVGPVSVTSIQDDAISLTIVSTASSVSDDCTGDPSCLENLNMRVTTGSPATAETTAHPGAVFTVNQLDVRVEAVGNGSAVLRLSTR